MASFLWRVIYAAVCVFIFWAIFPSFLFAIHLFLSEDVMVVLRLCVPCLALLYVLFGPSTSAPW